MFGFRGVERMGFDRYELIAGRFDQFGDLHGQGKPHKSLQEYWV